MYYKIVQASKTALRTVAQRKIVVQCVKPTLAFTMLLPICLSGNPVSLISNAWAAPFDKDNLPPGRLAEKINTLPDAAKKQALRWLERFEIPVEDYETIEVDTDGAIFYVDQPLAEQAESADTASDEPTFDYGMSASQAFSLHSKPGSSNTIFLDFDGHRVTGTVWSSGGDYDALPFDRDGDPYNFSASELNDIADIWHRVAEDYKPFDVNVTTEDPGRFGPNTGRVLITKKTDADGKGMPYGGYGGVAYVGVWGRSDYEYYQPALVYYDNLGGGAPQYVAESAAHEMGHNVGLSHDGTSSTSYYSGHGSSFVKWAPIMGNSHNSQVSQWSKGEYSGANNKQDDLAILRSVFGASADDHADSMSGASFMEIASSGDVGATTPENDPNDFYSENKGIINSATDVDFFRFESGEGALSLQATPAWKAFRRDSYRGSNLDVEISLYDGAGKRLMTANPSSDTYAAIQTSVTEGTYYLAVKGIHSSNYSDYASQGQYFIDGYVPPLSSSVNQAPVAEDDSATVMENTSVTVDVLANDSDPDGDILSIADFRTANNGTLFLNGDQTFTYVPNANFSGFDYIDYWVTDGVATSSMATLVVTVEPQVVNQKPITVDDYVTMDANTSQKIVALSNDYDPDGDALSVATYRQAAYGSVTLNSDQTFTYVPNANFSGLDEIDYWINDGELTSSMGTIYITVEAVVVNQAPVAVNDAASLMENSSVVLNLLANDSDPEGATLSIANFSAAGSGTLRLNSDQTVTYTPNTNYSGTDTFDYWATDGDLSSNKATVSITIDPEVTNQRPVAVNDAISVTQDQSITFNALNNDYDPDGDTVVVSTFRAAINGVVTLNSDQTFTYQPNNGFYGADEIDYWITDGSWVSSMATVTIQVNQAEVINSAPIAVNDSAVVDENSAVIIQVLVNDYDPEGDLLSITNIGTPNHGSVELNGDQSLTYTPNANFSGSDSFTYRLSDGEYTSELATVSVTINPAPNQRPIANDDAVIMQANSTIVIEPLSNDVDSDGDSLTISSVREPNHGVITVNSDNTITYVPNANFEGIDQIDYWITDGAWESSMASIYVTVEPETTLVQAPEMPSDLSGSVSYRQVILNWSDVVGEEKYTIERQKALKRNEGSWYESTFFEVDANATTYVDSVNKGVYRYRIMASNSTGRSNWSTWIKISVRR